MWLCDPQKLGVIIVFFSGRSLPWIIFVLVWPFVRHLLNFNWLLAKKRSPPPEDKCPQRTDLPLPKFVMSHNLNCWKALLFKKIIAGEGTLTYSNFKNSSAAEGRCPSDSPAGLCHCTPPRAKRNTDFSWLASELFWCLGIAFCQDVFYAEEQSGQCGDRITMSLRPTLKWKKLSGLRLNTVESQ